MGIEQHLVDNKDLKIEKWMLTQVGLDRSEHHSPDPTFDLRIPA